MYNSPIDYYQFGYSGYDSLLKQGSVYTQSELLANGVIREIVCDIDDKWMRVTEMDEGSKERHEIDLSVLKYGVTVDLSENGERWEGIVLNGYPYGYGCLYNSENQLIYSGFIYEGLKVCYGVEMYGDIGIVEYEGGYFKGMRFGYGKLYDKKNELIYEGEWYMNNPLETRSVKIDRELKEEDIHFGLEELEIGDDCLDNIECFKLIGFDHLKKLIFHNNSLKNLDSLVISNNNELEIIEIENGEYGYWDDDSENTGVCYNAKSVEISSIF